MQLNNPYTDGLSLELSNENCRVVEAYAFVVAQNVVPVK